MLLLMEAQLLRCTMSVPAIWQTSMMACTQVLVPLAAPDNADRAKLQAKLPVAVVKDLQHEHIEGFEQLSALHEGWNLVI